MLLMKPNQLFPQLVTGTHLLAILEGSEAPAPVFIRSYRTRERSHFTVLRIRNVYPGSGSASKSSSIFNQKIVSKLSEIWSLMFIPDTVLDFLNFYPSRIPNPGLKRERIWIRNTAIMLLIIGYRLALLPNVCWHSECFYFESFCHTCTKVSRAPA